MVSSATTGPSVCKAAACAALTKAKTSTTTQSQVRELNSVQPVRRSVRVLDFSSRAECEIGRRDRRTAPAR
jgi:hypothetical protein